MTAHPGHSAGGLHRYQQAVKWTIYAILLVNFGFCIAEDWNRAVHTLDAGSSLLDWAAEFATTIDELVWIAAFGAIEINLSELKDELLEDGEVFG